MVTYALLNIGSLRCKNLILKYKREFNGLNWKSRYEILIENFILNDNEVIKWRKYVSKLYNGLCLIF